MVHCCQTLEHTKDPANLNSGRRRIQSPIHTWREHATTHTRKTFISRTDRPTLLPPDLFLSNSCNSLVYLWFFYFWSSYHPFSLLLINPYCLVGIVVALVQIPLQVSWIVGHFINCSIWGGVFLVWLVNADKKPEFFCLFYCCVDSCLLPLPWILLFCCHPFFRFCSNCVPSSTSPTNKWLCFHASLPFSFFTFLPNSSFKNIFSK